MHQQKRIETTCHMASKVLYLRGRKPSLQKVNLHYHSFSTFPFSCAYASISFALLLLFSVVLVSYTWLQVSGKIRPAFQISLMATALVSFIHKMNRSRWFLELNLPISIPQLSPHRVTLNTFSRILEGGHAIEQWSLKGIPKLLNS